MKKRERLLTMTNRVVNKDANSTEIALRYEEYDFDSHVVVTGKGKGVERSVCLDKPIPVALEVGTKRGNS